VANGAAVFTVVKADAAAPSGVTNIASVAPAVFGANSNGQGVAAGLIFRVRANGPSGFEPIVQFDSARNAWVSVPINLGPPSDALYLVLFVTGARFRSSLESVSLSVGGVETPVLFAGAQGAFEGLDQINALAPRSLAGRGETALRLVVDGVEANETLINFK
jgi:uncharacterized protein (TIGR03437 family)